MPYYVVMGFSVTNKNTGERGLHKERLIEFETEDLYEQQQDTNFNDTLHIINKALPNGIYIDKGFPEPMTFLGETIPQKYEYMIPKHISITGQKIIMSQFGNTMLKSVIQ